MSTERNIHKDYLQKEMFSPSCVHVLSTQYNITFFHWFSQKRKETLYSSLKIWHIDTWSK